MTQDTGWLIFASSVFFNFAMIASCNDWDSVHKSKILAKISDCETTSYQRNIRFQCHRCDTNTQPQVIYYLIEKTTDTNTPLRLRLENQQP
nr:MAG TPA: hypothetical protein [Caudoviricetes sp.]